MPRKKKMNRAANGMGNIRKISQEKNGKTYVYWQARYTIGYDPATGKQKQKTISGKTQKEVAEKLNQAICEANQGIRSEPCHMTVKEWLDIWKQEYTNDVKESTANVYRNDIDRYVIPYIGAIKLKSLTTPVIQKLYNQLLKPEKNDVRPLSAKSVRNVHGVLHKALEQAVLIGYLRSNPADASKPPKAVKKEIHPLDETQVTAFLNAVQGHTHEYLYKIAVFTGLREGEILGLTWECVDFRRGTLLVKQQVCYQKKKGGIRYLAPTKNSKARTLKLAPTVLRLFREQKLKQGFQRLKAGDLWEEHNLVFTNQIGGFLSHRTVYDCFKRIMVKIGSPSTRFHDLRHTYAVLAIKSGDDIKTIQENLGHASAAFTLDVYGHLTAQILQDSAERMERMIQSVSAQ